MDCVIGYSFAAWLQIDESMWPGTVNRFLLSSGDDDTLDPGSIIVRFKSEKVTVTTKERPTGRKLSHSEPFTSSEWFHLTITFDKSGQLLVYINGTLVGNGSSSSHSVSNTSVVFDMHLGRWTSRNDKFGNFSMDEWYVWDEVLTATEVAEFYESSNQETEGNFFRSLNVFGLINKIA